MLRGYRCILVAAFGWVALCGASPISEHAKSSASNSQPAPTTNATPPTPAVAADTTSNFTAYPGYDPDPCYKAKAHDAADLCAQWRASIAAEKAAHEARRSTNWTIIAAFLNTLSLIAVAVALVLTIESNRIARTDVENNRVVQRAWVTHETDVLNLRRREDGRMMLTFQMQLVNSGQTPAIKFQIYGAEISEATDDHIRKLWESDPHIGVIGPQRTKTSPFFEIDLVDAFEKKLRFRYRCFIEYWDIFTQERHTTDIISEFYYAMQEDPLIVLQKLQNQGLGDEFFRIAIRSRGIRADCV